MSSSSYQRFIIFFSYLSSQLAEIHAANRTLDVDGHMNWLDEEIQAYENSKKEDANKKESHKSANKSR